MAEIHSLEDFDLTAPIKTTIIFDDSDEETQPSNDFVIRKHLSETSKNSETTTYPDVQHNSLEITKLNFKINTITETTEKAHETTIYDQELSIKQSKITKTNQNITESVAKTSGEEFPTPLKKRKRHLNNIKNAQSLNIGSVDEKMQHNQSVINILDTIDLSNKKISTTSPTEVNKKSREMPSLDEDNSLLHIGPQSYLEYCYHNININKNTKDCSKTHKASLTPSKQKTKTKEVSSASKIKSTKLFTPPSGYNINNNIETPRTEYYHCEQQNVIQGHNKGKSNNAIPESTNNDTTTHILQSVSENLIRVLVAYQTYINYYISNSDSNIIDNKRNIFIHTKRHFFDLSCSSVINIILPRENDLNFIKNFIEDTTKLINSKSLNCSYRDIYNIFKDLINWAKKRKQHVEQTQHTSKQQNSHPILLQRLRIPPKPFQEERRPPPEYKNHSNTAMNLNQSLPYEPPRISSSNINQTYSNNKSFQKQSLYHDPTATQISQKHYENHIYNSQIQENIGPSQNDHFTSLQKQIQLYSKNNNNEQNLPQNIMGYTTQLAKPASPSTGVILANQRYHGHKQLNSSQHDQSLWSEQLRPEQSLQEQRSSDHMRSADADQLRLEKIRTELLADLFRSEQVGQYHPDQIRPDQLQQQQTINNHQQPVELQRSSLSRDSGFISPLNFYGTNDQMTNCTPEEDTMVTTPLITHVTSLNSNAVYINEGWCYICGSTTRKMCLGCYNRYYCSSVCQNRDWKNHRALCKTT